MDAHHCRVDAHLIELIGQSSMCLQTESLESLPTAQGLPSAFRAWT